ncbi:Protein of unknown function with PCYCGC motif-containing protein [Paenibacillus sp. 1_12]|uniref:PCYCGC motif-containing (lipo)protein n=1 Tax=Paenibacillus sp. 1_12 TaxID=1566278 RepID=UPI0008E4A311|nr:PCYCGC motif-containing (lipo)protein [Paenibacillus sp. 1_12]SFL56509.1 Protein of unknown function with PCYCGC motif-containing protein [Paenibacillus sp. 1_12]
MKLTTIRISLSLLAMLTLAACSSKGVTEQAGHPAAHHGDLQETTSSINTLPTFLKNQPEQTQKIYQIASLSIDKLQWIPCYCGCGDEVGHKNNMNCFIKELKNNGSVVWDDHGTRCGVCMEIALTTAQLSKDGKSIKDIRNYIDTRYNKGYAKPTPTPMPA